MKILNVLLIMLLHIGLQGQSCKEPKITLKLYAYPMNTFTRIPITKNDIKDVSRFKKKIKKGNEFISKLENSLSDTVEPKDVKANKNHVRIYIEVCSKGKVINEIIISKSKNFQYKNKYYDLNNDILLHILQLIPKDEREDYTPMYLQEK